MTSIHIRIIILVALFTLISSARLEAFNIEDVTDWKFPVPPTATAVGSDAATKLLPKLVGNNDHVAENLGFNDATELAVNQSNINVGPPYPVFRISIEHLKNFNWKEQNPISLLLLEKTNFLRWSKPVPAQFLFPIMSGGVAKLSVLVGMSTTDHEWRMLQLGSPEKIKSFSEANAPPPDYFIVEVQALDRYYLGRIAGEDFTILHVVKERVQNIEIRTGPEPALDVFKRLQPLASQVYANQVPR